MREDRIKYNHIRHTQEALEEIFEGLKKQDLWLLSFGTDQLMAFGLDLADGDRNQFECMFVDYQVPTTLPNQDYVEAWKRAKALEVYLKDEMYDKNGDLWYDSVIELMTAVDKLLPKK